MTKLKCEINTLTFPIVRDFISRNYIFLIALLPSCNCHSVTICLDCISVCVDIKQRSAVFGQMEKDCAKFILN